MKLLRKIESKLNSSAGSYIFYCIAILAFAFFKSADWTYGWIAELYPMGEGFITLMFAIIITCAVTEIIYLILKSVKKPAENIVIRIIHLVFEALSVIVFVYTLVLLLGLDSGISSQNISRGVQALMPMMGYVGFGIAIPLAFVFCDSNKKTAKAIIAVVVICAIVIAPLKIGTSVNVGSGEKDFMAMDIQSKNIIENGKITFESLKKGEEPDAENLLCDNDKCWTPQSPNRSPAQGYDDANNSVVEIELSKTSAFNTAVIKEMGNQVQYFRLQALVDGQWITFYQSEKIQDLRLCSFDAVTTDRIRLSIDKFRSNDTPAKIKSIELYNEPLRKADNFEATVYQRLDGDVPTEILAKGEDYARNYAKFYDVYTTVIVFAAISWDENGNINYGEKGEKNFAQEISALKKIIALRSNQSHQVKLIITGLADGTGGDHGGVNAFMENNWEKVADGIAELVNKYNFDGVDIDWEYPQTGDDWKRFDSFIAKIDDAMNNGKDEKIISTALSSGSLGLSRETFERIDQIQYMAYDGNDIDGYQSSLQQAQEGVAAFAKNGADISKINIGIAAYGRPVNSTPYWAIWRNLEQANYWDSKYYNVEDGNQIYDGTFCSPALAGDKTAYALFSGCGGVMVFRIGCDKTMDNPNSVACGIKNAIDRYIEK
ncbi:MAG: glycoside hydrolase family 18 protein [Eubacterium sp.]